MLVLIIQAFSQALRTATQWSLVQTARASCVRMRPVEIRAANALPSDTEGVNLPAGWAPCVDEHPDNSTTRH
eukprot:1087715-Prorocentrum_minimum.AAC.1